MKHETEDKRQETRDMEQETPVPEAYGFGTGQARDKYRIPRMVWAQGERIKELSQLKEDLEDSLSEKVRFEIENRAFSPHITLARITGWQFKAMEPEEVPEINEDISLGFEVNSIEVMESELSRGGAEYCVLESIPLANVHE